MSTLFSTLSGPVTTDELDADFSTGSSFITVDLVPEPILIAMFSTAMGPVAVNNLEADYSTATSFFSYDLTSGLPESEGVSGTKFLGLGLGIRL